MAQEIEVKVKVVTDQAVTNVNKLGDAFDSTAQDAQEAQNVFEKTGSSIDMEPSINNLKQLKRELKAATAGTKDFDRLSMSIREMEDAIGDAKKSNDDFLGQMENASGPLGMLGKGIRSAETATSSFSGALKATGIGLVVALIGGLVAAFSENEAATKKLQPLLDGMKKIFQGIFRAVEPLFNTLVDLATDALPMVSKSFEVVYSAVTAVFQSLGTLGTAIMKLMKGDFKGAWSSAKESVSGFSKNYDQAVNNFQKGSKEMTASEKEEAAKRAELLEKQNEKRKAAEDKRLQNVKEHNQKLKEERERAAKEEAEFQIAHKEFLDKLDADSFQTKIAIGKENDEIQKEEKTLLALEEATLAAEIADKDENNRVLTLEKNKLTAEEELEVQRRKYEAMSLITQNGMNFISALQDAGIARGKAGQMAMKALTLAQIGLDTASAFSNAVPMAIKAGAEAAKLAGPAAPFVGPIATAASYIQSATMIASNIAKAKKLIGGGGPSVPSVSTPSGGGGASPRGVSTPNEMQPSVNVVGASQTNQIAQTMAMQAQRPVRAFVVGNDVTTQQGLDRSIVKSATLG